MFQVRKLLEDFYTDSLPVYQIWRHPGTFTDVFAPTDPSPSYLSSSVPQKADLYGPHQWVPQPSKFWVSVSNREPWQKLVDEKWVMMGYLFPELISYRNLAATIKPLSRGPL